MAEVEIILIRHGEAASGWSDDSDPGLSNLGKSQAEAVKENLESFTSQNFQLISSPKKRAIETAQPTSLDWKSEIKIDDAFSEIPASNIKLERRMEWLKSMMNMDIAMLPEDVKEWRSRIIKKLKNIKSNSIIFSHFMVINVVVGYIKNHPILLSMYPDNGSLTKIKVSNGEISLIKIGDEKNTKINT